MATTRDRVFAQKTRVQYNKMYKKICILGYGSFGTSAVHRRLADHSLVVIKEFNLPKCDEGRRVEDSLDMVSISHVNLIRYLNAFTLDRRLLVVTEYTDGDNLQSFLNSKIPTLLEEWEILVLFEQIVAGIDCLHSRHILHSNLKPSNIFVNNKGQVKLSDFGVGKWFFSTNYASYSATSRPSSAKSFWTPKGKSMISAQLASLACHSPERCAGSSASQKWDIWSLGCILYHLICQEPMFLGRSRDEIIEAINQVRYKPIERKISSALRDLFEQLVALLPNDRPESDKLLKQVHRMLVEINRESSLDSKNKSPTLQLRSVSSGASTGLSTPGSNFTEFSSQSSDWTSLIYQVKLNSKHITVERIDFPLDKRVKMMVKSKSHHLVLTHDNWVYGWGSKRHGQLGACGLLVEDHRESHQIKNSSKSSSSSSSSGAINSDDKTTAARVRHRVAPLPYRLCGSSDSSLEAGFKSSNSRAIRSASEMVISMLRELSPATRPFVVSELTGDERNEITQVAAGNNFSVFLTKSGTILTCGSAASGCLGREETLNVCFEPSPVDVSHLAEFTCISAGPEHVAAVCRSGQVYAWGNNTYGRLGVDPMVSKSRSKQGPKSIRLSSYVLRPRLCDFPHGVVIKRVFCGDRCSVFIDSNHKVWACGENSFNKLGLDEKRKLKRAIVVDECWAPRRVGALRSCRIRSCSLRKTRTSFITTSGKLIILGQDLDLNCRGLERSIFELADRRSSSWSSRGKRRVAKGKRCDLKLLVRLALRSNQISGFKLRRDNSNTAMKNAKKLSKRTRKQLVFYMRKSRSIRKISLGKVKSVANSARFSLALTKDNRILFWGSRSYAIDDKIDEESASLNELELASQEGTCVKLGQTNDSLLVNIEKFGYDQPIILVRDPKPDVKSLGKFGNFNRAKRASSSQPTTSSTSRLSSLGSRSWWSSCWSPNLRSRNSSYICKDKKLDFVSKPQSIISLYAPSALDTSSSSARLAAIYCFDKDKFYMIIETRVDGLDRQSDVVEEYEDFSGSISDMSPAPEKRSQLKLSRELGSDYNVSRSHDHLGDKQTSSSRRTLSTSDIAQLSGRREVDESLLIEKCNYLIDKMEQVNWPTCPKVDKNPAGQAKLPSADPKDWVESLILSKSRACDSRQSIRAEETDHSRSFLKESIKRIFCLH